jgi:acetylornithine deacetylase
LFRTIGPPENILRAMRPLELLVGLEEILRVPVVRLHQAGVEGIGRAVFPFTTDVPFLDQWGAPLLFGPGSFLVAHTDREHLRLSDLHEAVNHYERLIAACLADSAPASA